METNPVARNASNKYICFENQIRQALHEGTPGVCACCVSVCCREEICQETLESPWLRKVRRGEGQPVRKKDYHPERGWLTRSGCALSSGRPPVCYEFFCEKFEQTMEPRRYYALLVMGKLPGFVGARASGGRHLVALRSKTEISSIRYDRLIERIRVGEWALENCRKVLRGEAVDKVVWKEFRKITRPPVRNGRPIKI